MATCAITGVNWGDEGKGRMVDLIAEDYDIVVRYQGGSNAGHTIVNEHGKFALNLIPSGIFRKGVVNVLGNGMVIDPEHLVGEIEGLLKAGIEISPENLMISDRAVVVFPFHKELDSLEEGRLGDAKFGSTKRGIAPSYGDKYQKKAILMGELLMPEKLQSRLKGILDWKNLMIEGVYGEKPYSLGSMMDWLKAMCEKIGGHICDTGAFLRGEHAAGRNIMFESQLGALRDIDFGIYPYTSSSSPIAAYAPIGAGMPGVNVERVVGVVKAYSTCVGEGPFVAEWFGDEADELRRYGFEYGAATGRPRRVGPLDMVATRYGAQMQAATEIALTKLDVISYMKEIPVCTEYELDGDRLSDFPFPMLLNDCRPVIKTLPGWGEDISRIRRFEDLPKAARDYVLYIENGIGKPVSYVSVGPERDEIIVRL